MAINIDTLVHNEFSRSATDQLVRITRKPTDQIRAGVDRAVTEMLDNYSLMAREEAGRQTIYEASRYCDDGLIDDPAIFFSGKDERAAIGDSNNALSALLGGNTRAKIADAVRSSSGLSAQDADTITGYVAPGVLGVMKRQLLNGAVLDNSDGIGQMLLGETVVATSGGARTSIDHTVPKNAPRTAAGARPAAQSTAGRVAAGTAAASAATVGAAGAARSKTGEPNRQTTGKTDPARGAKGGSTGKSAATSGHSEGSDLSWLFRWVMPVVLLGGLVFAGLRGVGMQASAPAVDTSAAELLAVRGEADGLMAQVTSLTAERDEALGDRETAVGEIERLRGELDAAASATPDTSELDAANAEIVSLKDQLAQPADTSELDAANAEIVSLKSQLAQPADTGAVDTANAEIARLTSQLANVPAPVDNSAQIMALQGSVDDGALRITQLESELGTVRSSRDKLEESIATFRAEKTVTEDRNTELKEKLLAVAGAKNRLDGDIASLQAEGEAMVAKKDGRIEQLTTQRDLIISDIEGVRGQLDTVSAERDAASAELDTVTGQLDTATTERDAAVAELDTVTTERDTAVAELDNVTTERDTALAELDQEKSNATQLTADVAAANDATASVEAERDDAMGKVQVMQSNLDRAIDDATAKRKETVAAQNEIGTMQQAMIASDAALAKMKKGRSAAIVTVTDLARKLRASEAERNAAVADGEAAVAKKDSRIEQLTSQRDLIITDLEGVTGQLDTVTAERDSLASDRDSLSADRDSLTADRDSLTAERDALLADKSGLEQSLSSIDATIQGRKDEVATMSSILADRLLGAGVNDVNVTAIEDYEAVGITMGSSDLYSVGSASLSSQGTNLLETVGSLVSEYPDWRIDVEGHTDGQPIGSVLREKYPSNWELSVARASSAVRYLQTRVGIPATNMSVRGFGEHKPVDTNETAEGREANRRIELILRRQ